MSAGSEWSRQRRRRGTIRAQLQAQVDSGMGSCWRCGRWIPPGTTTGWHVGHIIGQADSPEQTFDRSNVAVECAKCNLRAAGRRTQAKRRARKRRASAWLSDPEGRFL